MTVPTNSDASLYAWDDSSERGRALTISEDGTKVRLDVDSELPPAQADGDDRTAADNPEVSALNFVFDGTNWDRWRKINSDLTAPDDGVGAVGLVLADGSNLRPIAVVSAKGDADGGLNSIPVGNQVFNGSDYDRERNNTEETVLASAARTTDTDSADFTNFNAKGATFVVDVSAIDATPSITVTIQGKDPISSNYYDLLVSSAITTVSTNVLTVFPGITATANESASDILPRVYRVSVAHGDADSITYSVSASLTV